MLPARIIAGVTWWREDPWSWSGNDPASGSCTGSPPGDVGRSGCLRTSPCRTLPAGDAPSSNTGCSRDLPPFGVPAIGTPPRRAPSRLAGKECHPRPGTTHVESSISCCTPLASMTWPRSSPSPAPFSGYRLGVAMLSCIPNAW